MPSSACSTNPPSCRYRLCRDDAGLLSIVFQGRLDESSASRLIKEFSTLLKEQKPRMVALDLSGVEYIDDFGVVLLAGIKSTVSRQGGRFRLGNIPAAVDRVLTMHHFSSLGQPAGAGVRDQSSAITRLGGATVKSLQTVSFMLGFLGDTCLSFCRVMARPRLLRGNDTLTNMLKIGVDALPIVGLISFLLGLIMAFMSSMQLAQFGANIYVASLVSLSMTRELGPIMTAIIVAGRSGSAFAAEIGTMKISEEIDALFTMGIDPHIFLVLPRMLAALLVVPLLTLFSDLFAILGGMLVGVSMLDLTVNGYINQTIHSLDLFDVYWGVGKAALFALLISWTGCLRGFQVQGGAAGVGQATTSAVVTSIFLIILSDSLLVVMLHYLER
ncbi:MAG: MlaE family lipid ABC transporter permease subunit [Desulfobacterales bacterium]|nr:MlaE family lipid ABC transporter permease subunit [Desulfobacterales bacterium]